MKKMVKILLAAVTMLLLVLVLAAVAATLLIDPNDYRDAIAAKVEEQTGRTLEISGEVRLSLFPWLGLALGEMELGNAKGFADGPFARIEAVEARVKLLPLFRLQTEVDTVKLRGLVLNLQRRADGVSNWDDLAKGDTTAALDKPEPKKGLPAADDDNKELEKILGALAVGGLVLEGANLQWQDDMNGQHLSLRQLNFSSGEIRVGKPIPLELTTELQSSAPEIRGSLRLAARVTADPLVQRYRAEGLQLHTALTGKDLPGGKLEAQLGGDAAVDLAAQLASLTGLRLSTMGLELQLSLQGRQIIDKPSFSGELASNEFVPRRLLSGLGIALPEMADPSAMGKAKMSTRLEGALDRIALGGLSLQLDNTTISGTAAVSNFAAPVIRYDLKLDEIDVDRYLAPPAESAEGGAKGAAGKGSDVAAAPTLPLKLLRSLDIDGSLNLGKVKIMNLHSDSVMTTLKASKGKFRVHPLSANLYQGDYSGDLGFDVSGKEPRLSLNEKLSGVESGPLLKDFMGEALVTGTASVAAKMTARGLDAVAMRKTLNGSGNFRFANGTVKGINIGQQIRNAYALYKKQPQPAQEEKSTDFADLSGSFKVQNGVVSTADLSAKSPVLQVAGSGTANLVTERLNLRLDTTIIHRKGDIASGGADELKGRKIPVTVKGSFSDPKIGVDVESVLRAKAKAKVEQKKAEAKAELEKKKRAAEAEARKKLEAEKRKLEQQMQDKLKNMLKF